LLAETGRAREASALAEQETLRPRSVGELIMLAETLYGLGLRGHAEKLLRQYSLQPGRGSLGSPQEVWLERAALLANAADWDGLLEMVDDLHASPRALAGMGGWVDFLEGRAHHGLEHFDQARAAMETAAQKSFPSPQIAYDVGLGLKQLGYSEFALRVLGPLESARQNDPLYWQSVFQLAEALRQDPILLLKAAREARRLLPGDDQWDFSYAAALLVNRLEPAEAVTITRALLTRTPTSAQAQVNHCLALVLNRRWEEATTLLAAVDSNRFDELGQTVYHLCALEIHLASGQKELARKDAALVQRRHLFPNQVQWLEQTLNGSGLTDGANPAAAPGR
jgi:hypothetical protein